MTLYYKINDYIMNRDKVIHYTIYLQITIQYPRRYEVFNTKYKYLLQNTKYYDLV